MGAMPAGFRQPTLGKLVKQGEDLFDENRNGNILCCCWVEVAMRFNSKE